MARCHCMNRSEHGATFSMALLLLLVCTVVSAVVLASASSSVGTITNQGKTDQRYYSVTSAVNVFTAYVGNGVKLSSKQERKGGTEASVQSVAVDERSSLTKNETNAFDDLLIVPTSYALYGTTNMSEAASELQSLGQGSWLEPFQSAYWTTNTSVSATAIITPTWITPTWQPTVGRGEKEFDCTVEAEALITKNGQSFIEFRNRVENEEDAYTDQYTVLVTMNADISSPSAAGANGESTVSYTITSVEPGGCIPNV